ncbi:MAG: carbohydrate-binding module family 20 domain-containing protein [Acidobacteriota bacterium]
MRALPFVLLAACAADPNPPADCTPGDLACDPATSGKADGLTASGMPLLPAPGGTGALTPWGGTDPTRWRSEAIMANAASQALNEAWSRAGVADAIVAMPMHMLNSSFKEFGDGQDNVAPSFVWWTDSRPPVVATLIEQTGGGMTMVLLADHALPNSDATWDATYTVHGQTKTVSLPITRRANGDGVAEWSVPAELGWDDRRSTQVVLVHPHTWGDWFPLMFRFPVRPIASLKSEILPGFQTFADGGDDQDHEGVSVQTHPGPGTPFERLSSHAFSSAYNQSPFTPQDIHAVFPSNGHNYVTGVGMGWTWVANVPAAPFKIMYTCFDKRNAAAEASAPDGGVASGGGWHRIGDNAETVLNDLEGGPLVLGSAMAMPLATALPSGGYAYGLTDVATVRWVKPGEAFVTPRGLDPQWNYHWYFFAGDKPVCTEEWVHPCRPTSYGFACDDQSAVTFQVDNATTSWGQNVYVVGDAPALAGWNPAAAVPLAATAYPSWTGRAFLPRNTTVNFKFIKKDGSGNTTWEGGANQTFAVPDAATSSFTGSWQ